MSRARSSVWAALALAGASPAVADSTDADIARFVPAQWKSVHIQRGDLTGDNIPDVVLLVQGTDPAKRIHNDGLGEALLDTNPRRVIVLQGLANGFRQIAASERLVPAEGNAESRCLADPLEDGGITIRNRLLKVDLNYWLSCGGYGVTQRFYTFRAERGRMRLIGFDRLNYSRASGIGDAISIDFLRGRIKRSSDMVVIGEDNGKRTKVRWSRTRPQLFWLEDVAVTTCDDPDPLPTWC